MALLGRSLVLLLAVCCLTWLGVLWWWQRHAPELQESDLVTYLVLLPLTVFVLVLALRWAWRSATARAAAAASAAPAEASAEAPAVAVAGDASERHRTWQLVQVGMAVAVAEQGQELLEAAEQGEPLPAPDSELLDAAGLPVLTVRGTDSQDEIDALAHELAEHDPVWQDGAGLRDGGWRALLLGRRVLEPLAQWLAQWTEADAAARETDGPAGAASEPRHAMRVVLGVDADWDDTAKSRLQAAMVEAWQQTMGPKGERWDVAWDVVAGSAEALWLKADQLILSADRMGQRVWTLVLACSSAIDQEVVDSWQAQGCLMAMPAQPRGRVPGEAAAAFLVAPQGWAPLPDTDGHSVYLSRPVVSRRTKPIEAPGKVDHQVLEAVLLQALEAAALTAADVVFLVCDADRHSHRATELYGVTLAQLPALDPVEDMRLLASVTGHTGCASALLLVAAATDWVRKKEQPCVLLSQADAHDRMALVLRPAAAAPAAA